MVKESDEHVEFLEEEAASSKSSDRAVVRRSYRIPLQDASLRPNLVTAIVDKTRYAVADVSAHGVSILFPPDDPKLPEPAKGGRVAVTLYLDDVECAMQATPVHLEIYGKRGLLCGLEFVDASPEDRKTLDAFLKTLKQRLFQDGVEPPPLPLH